MYLDKSLKKTFVQKTAGKMLVKLHEIKLWKKKKEKFEDKMQRKLCENIWKLASTKMKIWNWN